MKIRARVIITGLVQGVNFRHNARQAALGLKVTGWVMNLPDGSVAGCFEGEEAGVNALVAWCRRGPDWSRVEDVMATTGEYRGEFYDFTIRR